MASARRLAWAAALAAVLLLPSLASAFTVYRLGFNYLRWPDNNIVFEINTEGMPSGSDRAIQDSFNTWSNAGANLIMINGGGTSSHAYGERDYTNIIDYGELDDDGTIAETTYWFNPRTGAVTDNDVRLNQNLLWGVNGDAGVFDVQALMTHELGHTLVLGDLYGRGDTEKTMYGYGDKGETKARTLDDDDINGIRFLYP